MTKYIFSLLALALFTSICIAQKSSKLEMNKVYLDKKDSTKNVYTILHPAKKPYKGFLILLPGFGENAERVMQQTDLAQKSALNGILTIIPNLQDGVLSFGVDSASQQSLENIIAHVINSNHLTDQPLFIGGYSIGGSAAIKYAEYSKIKPAAVFAVDPPLDFERLYHSAKRDIRLSKNTKPNDENIYIIERLEKEIGGSPDNALSAYYSFSPYSFSDTSQVAIKKLGNTPIRIYTEPDIEWWMKERNTDVTGMNATECSAMINELKKLGHNNAALIITHRKGFRKPDHARHPHSWSIVDNDALIRWLLKQ